VTVDWIEGDAEQLPFAGESFDRVLSAFGVQFAPRHQVVADELVRVLRPGGVIGVVNWTPDGIIGRVLRIIGAYMPPPPSYASSPALWGDEEHVHRLFDGSGLTVTCHRGHNPWRFPSPAAWVEFMETAYGPMLKAREKHPSTWFRPQLERQDYDPYGKEEKGWETAGREPYYWHPKRPNQVPDSMRKEATADGEYD
jgi:SAM-dependent methyltransferase